MTHHSHTIHLEGNETVALASGDITDSLVIGPREQVRIVLASYIPAADRVRFLRELSEAASELAHDIDLRDLEAAS